MNGIILYINDKSAVFVGYGVSPVAVVHGRKLFIVDRVQIIRRIDVWQVHIRTEKAGNGLLFVRGKNTGCDILLFVCHCSLHSCHRHDQCYCGHDDSKH